MSKHVILVVLLAITAVFAIEFPSKNSKVVYNEIIRVGDKIAQANIVGVVGECFYGFNTTCTDAGYELTPCGDSTEEGTTGETAVGDKRELVTCGDNCECGVSIPSDGLLVLVFDHSACTGSPATVLFAQLDTCISNGDTIYTYTTPKNVFTFTEFETEGCGGTSNVLYEKPIEECHSGDYIILTSNLEGSVATWIASVVLIVLSVVVSA